MNIPEKLKVNHFRMVRIPKKGELYRQYGELNGQANYSGDQVAENAGRKSERYAESEALMEQLDRKRQEEEDNKK